MKLNGLFIYFSVCSEVNHVTKLWGKRKGPCYLLSVA